MPIVAIGYDCSWDPPDQGCMRGQGATFIVRYGSRDPSKNLTQSELDSALRNMLSVAIVWQEGKTQMLRGYPGGQTDAEDADAFVRGLGLAGIPIYFSCDFDPASGDWVNVDAYMDGAKSIVGKGRTGGYGGKPFISRQFDAGRMTWGWQTYAWSGGSWDTRAQLRQVQNEVTLCGGKIDWDEAWYSDFGQWPRPSAPPVATTADEDDEQTIHIS